MAWGINLRSDLAQLSNAELSAEIDRLTKYHSSRFGCAPPVGNLSPRGLWRTGLIWPFGRGPLRARWAYRFWIFYYWPFRGPIGTQYMVECELADLRDEARRRSAFAST